MKKRLNNLTLLFAPTITLLIVCCLLSFEYDITINILFWIIMISISTTLILFFIRKKRSEEETDISCISFQLLSAFCAVYLICDLTREEKIFGTIFIIQIIAFALLKFLPIKKAPKNHP